jgi:hypothetical protein
MTITLEGFLGTTSNARACKGDGNDVEAACLGLARSRG